LSIQGVPVSETLPTDTQVLAYDSSTDEYAPAAAGGGDVTGPGSSTDNAVVRFDGAGGKTIQNSGVIVDDSDNVTAPGSVHIIGSSGAASTILSFPSSGSTGALTWDGASDLFSVLDDMRFALAEKLQFRDSALFIHSPADGQLHAEADTKITLGINGTEHLEFIKDATASKGAIGLNAPSSPDRPLDIWWADNSNGLQIRATVASTTASHQPYVVFRRSRGTAASPANNSAGDSIGSFTCQTYSSGFKSRASFIGKCDTGGANTGKLVFRTGSASISDQVEIDSGGDMLFIGANECTFRAATQAINSPSTNVLDIDSGTTLNLQISAVDEVTVTANTMAFQSGGTAPTFTWLTAGQLDMDSNGSLAVRLGVSNVSIWKPLLLDDDLGMKQLSADPSAPATGYSVIWASDGTGKGDAGDVMIASNVGGTTKYATLFDYSAGAAW
jgi:hypothetical protein